MKNSNEDFFTKHKNTIAAISLMIGAISLLFIMVSWSFTIGDQIDKRIENKITNETYIENLSRTLRPFFIFNEKGIVEYDHGAKDIMERIKFDKEKQTITIFFKIYLQNPPLLMVIGDVQYAYVTERSKKNGWKFMLDGGSVLWDGPSKYGNKYILEILK